MRLLHITKIVGWVFCTAYLAPAIHYPSQEVRAVPWSLYIRTVLIVDDINSLGEAVVCVIHTL